MKKKILRNFILWLMLCVVALLGMCPGMDAHALQTAGKSVPVISAPANAGYDCVWTGETAGQRSELLRRETRLRSSEGRIIRSLQIFFFVSLAILPGILLKSCRLFCADRERKIEREDYIIRFIHNLDGRKRVLS